MDGLQVTPSSFADAMALQRAVAKAIKATKIDIGELADSISGGSDVSDIEIGSESLETIIKTVISIGISKEIESCLFVCAKKALYKGEKVDQDFFEQPEKWELYYPIMIDLSMVNISPFFKSLGTLFKGFIPKVKTNIQK